MSLPGRSTISMCYAHFAGCRQLPLRRRCPRAPTRCLGLRGRQGGCSGHAGEGAAAQPDAVARPHHIRRLHHRKGVLQSAGTVDINCDSRADIILIKHSNLRAYIAPALQDSMLVLISPAAGVRLVALQGCSDRIEWVQSMRTSIRCLSVVRPPRAVRRSTRLACDPAVPTCTDSRPQSIY
jgi:hypothetical protein